MTFWDYAVTHRFDFWVIVGLAFLAAVTIAGGLAGRKP